MIDWGAMFEPEMASDEEARPPAAAVPRAPPGDGDTLPPDTPCPPMAASAATIAAVVAPGLREQIEGRERQGDNRRRCVECAERTPRGRCLAVARGAFVAARGYEPIANLLRRCEGFSPMPDDPDQRSSADRWPCLVRAAS